MQGNKGTVQTAPVRAHGIIAGALALAVALGVAGSGRLTAQEVNPGVTAVPPRIISAMNSAGEKSAASDQSVAALSLSTAPFQTLNAPLPKWIRFSFIERLRMEGTHGIGFKPGDANQDDYLLHRFRFGTLLRPTSWLRVYGEIQDARQVWKKPPVGPPNQNTWDLRQAYVEIGGREDQPFDIKIGRQVVNFGAGRVIGNSDWRGGRTWDAALVALRAGRFRITPFSMSVVNLTAAGLSHHQDGNVLHGIYGGIDNLIPNSVIEPYVIWRLGAGFKTEAGNNARIDEKTIGARWAGMVSTRIDYAVEALGQYGNISTDKIGAWATYLTAGYTVTSVKPRPRFFVEYYFNSGDSTPKDGRRGTFDQLYPTAHDRNGVADQIGWQNLKAIRTGSRLHAAKRWALAGIYSNWYLASSKDALYNQSAGVLVAADPTGKSGSHIGQEIDGETSYRINREIEVGAGVGHIFPGDFLKARTPGKAYTYPYVVLNFTL